LRASIDIGSNSTLLLVGEASDLGIVEKASESRVTSLGKFLDQTGEFARESMELTEKAISEYTQIAKSFGVNSHNIIITATEASRVAKNAKTFYSDLAKKYQVVFNIISGEGEAHYAANGVSLGVNGTEDEVVIMDVGGASTELIKLQLNPFKIISSISTPMGSVRATEWLSQGIFQSKVEGIIKDHDLSSYKTQKLVCVAGTMTSIGNMALENRTYDEAKLHGAQLSLDKFDGLIESYRAEKPENLLVKYPFLGKRSQTVIGGAQVAQAMAHTLGSQVLEISVYGLRHGTLKAGKLDSHFIVEKIGA